MIFFNALFSCHLYALSVISADPKHLHRLAFPAHSRSSRVVGKRCLVNAAKKLIINEQGYNFLFYYPCLNKLSLPHNIRFSCWFCRNSCQFDFEIGFLTSAAEPGSYSLPFALYI